MGIREGMGKGPLGSEMSRSQRYNIPGGLIRVYIIYTDRKSFEQSREQCLCDFSFWGFQMFGHDDGREYGTSTEYRKKEVENKTEK